MCDHVLAADGEQGDLRIGKAATDADKMGLRHDIDFLRTQVNQQQLVELITTGRLEGASA